MKIDKNKVARFSYELTVDGEIVDRSPEDAPLGYIHGDGTLLPKFDEKLEGLVAGDGFEFSLSPEEAYGEHDPNKVIELPMAVFTNPDGTLMEVFLRVGAMVPLSNGRGQVIPGKVIEVGTEAVTVDLNSDKAGKTLNFKGVIIYLL